ncbi:twin-arginine translocase TatA/TatE family subunit [Peribacillus sp. NJ11]|uniref:twin-arginine translocase TatA/TatE family subunit n=1 Tax=Peribacillus sp. NJ11 TaxID=3055861 RepID=UPI0025A0CF5B|nr:twin-arginine translocase TatA/TatE family subunit [Peribacillus sp. NJ11]MDM5223092.1 twin-arginine translocase TatA/TatE family subunit [Peribacillus sp. NJ11]
MFQNLGVPGLVIILITCDFGPEKSPEIGRAFGRTLSEYKSATKGLVDEEKRKIKNLSY